MAITPCEPCDCVSPNIPNDLFKQQVLIVLCAILDALQNPPLSLEEKAATNESETPITK